MFNAFRRVGFGGLLQSDRGCVGLLVALFFGFNLPLALGLASPHWDGSDFFGPYYALVASLARSGHFMLWNPLSSGGSPDCVEPQLGAASPVTLLFGLIAGPSPLAFNYYWLCVWLLGSLGMYVLARALQAPPWGALLISLGFTFSGYYFGHAEHTSVIYTYSFVPWALWRLRKAMLSGDRWAAVQAGALWGLSALAGNVAVLMPAGMFLGAIAPAWLPVRPGLGWAGRVREYAITLGLVLLVGVAVLAPAYLGFRYETLGFSSRSHPLPREAVLLQSLALPWLSTFVNPILCVVVNVSLPGRQADGSMIPVYFGAVLPVLALFTLWRRRTHWRNWTVAVVGLLFLGIALGSTLPLRGWLYDLLPVTRYFRYPPMFRGFFILAVAMLAAPATGVIQAALRPGARDATRHLRPLGIIAVVCAVPAIVTSVCCLWVGANPPPDLMLVLSVVHTGVAWIGVGAVCRFLSRRTTSSLPLSALLLTLSVVDLGGAYFMTRDFTFSNAPLAPAIQPVVPLIDLGTAGFNRAPHTPASRNLYEGRATFVNYAAMPSNHFYDAWTADRLLTFAVSGPRRLWFAPDAPSLPPTPATYAAFARKVHEGNRFLIVRHSRESLLHEDAPPVSAPVLDAVLDATPSATKVDFQVERYQPNALVLNVTCPESGFLLLTDRWTRSWEAKVNGQMVPVEGGDFLFRTVPVIAGKNRVEMRFNVAWFYPLVALSWTTLAVALGSVWWSRKSLSTTPPVPTLVPIPETTAEYQHA